MTTAQAESTIPTGSWRADSLHSHVGFAVKHNQVATFRGSFGDYEVLVSDADGGPKLSGLARVESVQVDDENLHGHLLSPEFFDAEWHPEVRFESSSIAREDDQLVVQGELTIKGTTKPVVAHGEVSGPVVGAGDSERIGLDLETRIDRNEYGVDFNAPLPDGGRVLEDEVTISVHLELQAED